MTRTCDQCGKHLITHRKGARFCDKDCSNAWHNEQRRSGTATNKHLTPVSEAEGSRGGNVRSVDEARILQSESKERDRWRLIMEIQIHRTLLSTGYFHVDDLDALGVPPIASEVKGTLVNAIRARGYMKSSGVQRKVAHPAANARKAWIYQITAKGRRDLPGLVADLQKEIAGLTADSELDSPPHSHGVGAVSGQSGEAELTGLGGGAVAPLPGDNGTATPDKPPAGVDREEPQGTVETSAAPGDSVHSGGSSAAVSSRPQGSGEVRESTSPRTTAEPVPLPGFEESAAARNLKDAA